MSGISQGVLNNSRRATATDPNRFEVVSGTYEMKNLPFPQYGKLNGAVGYPTKLEEGYFLSLADFGTADSLYGVEVPPVGEPITRPERDTHFYDYAPNLSKPVYLYFSPFDNVSNGINENTPMYSDSPSNTVLNPDYQPGAMYAYAGTGLFGTIVAFFPPRCTTEGTLAAYLPGTALTVVKGKLQIGVSGDKRIGTVEYNDRNKKVKVIINNTGSYPTI
jgi:hypothetical protein